jgi:hypothetical protein
MYFPKSQIKPNLYTNGGEYILSTTKEDYKGYYYEVSTRQRYTGKTPQDGANILLIKSQELNDIPNQSIPTLNSDNAIIIPNSVEGNYFLNLDFSKYPKIKEFSNRIIPQPNPTLPTNQDIKLGVYTRYFCKKNNELKYIEIDKTTFEKLNSKSKDIAWDLYTPISTLWYIRGDADSYKANKGLISLIEKNQKWYGFTQWFKEKF